MVQKIKFLRIRWELAESPLPPSRVIHIIKGVFTIGAILFKNAYKIDMICRFNATNTTNTETSYTCCKLKKKKNKKNHGNIQDHQNKKAKI